MKDNITTFKQFAIENNFPLEEEPIADNSIHRFGTKKRYWYVYDHDYGVLGDWTEELPKANWFANNRSDKKLSDLEKQDLIRKQQEAAQRRNEKLAQQHKLASTKASKLFNALPKDGNSEYLNNKQVKAHNIAFGTNWQNKNYIVVPLHDVEGTLWSLQFIYDKSSDNKRFFPNGKIQGNFHVIGDLTNSAELYICEGYATAATIYELTNKCTIVAFNAGNLLPVTQAIQGKYPDKIITIAGDNDHTKPSNTGKVKAEETAKICKAKVLLPDFSNVESSVELSDWNDLYLTSGGDEVLKQLAITSNRSLNPKHTIEELSNLSEIEYEKVREDNAKQLGVRTSVLDKAVNKSRQKNKPREAIIFPEVEAWPDNVDLAILLDEIAKTIKRFIICDEETAIATALWCAFTWIIDYVQVAPIAVITAPEMRCGKSQLLNIIERLSKRSLIASNITPSAMFRVIESCQPTLLIDEADAFLKESEELRGVINSGHTRQSAYVIRTTGDNFEPKQFSTWGAKAICGIGSVQGTIQDRAIILKMRRKLPDEKTERIRHAEHGMFEQYKSKLLRFAIDACDYIKNAKPYLPEELNDRAQDNWEPLFIIADYAGNRWPNLARKTALAICGMQQESVSISCELLADIQEMFDLKKIDKVKSTELIEYLISDDEKPWSTYNRGKHITTRQLSKRLKEYNISSKDIRFGYEGVKKGYEKLHFEDAFNRYLSSSSTLPEKYATEQLDTVEASLDKESHVADDKDCRATELLSATPEAAKTLGCCVVADKRGEASKDIVEVSL